MFATALSTDTLRGLKKIGKSGILDHAYLAGGTALALRFGHRLSLDLDFFTQEPFEALELIPQLKSIGQFELDREGWRTVLGTFEKVKFSIFYYEYPLLVKTDDFQGIKISNLSDLAAMKLAAVGDRGTRRDFVDLFFLKDHFSVKQMLEFYDQKFGKAEERTYHILRGLQYFVDAEEQEMPTMLKKVSWKDIRTYFEQETKLLIKELITG